MVVYGLRGVIKMRKETVEAKTKKKAAELMSWASVIVRVDSGNANKAWMGFESLTDFQVWKNQK